VTDFYPLKDTQGQRLTDLECLLADKFIQLLYFTGQIIAVG